MDHTLDRIVNLARSEWARDLQRRVFSAMEPSQAQPQESAEEVAGRTVLAAAAHILNPGAYLEIGTRRGHSLCLVGAASPGGLGHATCVDPWLADYGGEPNPGKELVAREFQKFSPALLEFHQEDSALALPKLCGREFGLIFVDGDHSVEGALRDLDACANLLPPGGILVFDDLSHPAHELEVAWERWAANHPWRTRSGDDAYGWAIAQAPEK